MSRPNHFIDNTPGFSTRGPSLRHGLNTFGNKKSIFSTIMSVDFRSRGTVDKINLLRISAISGAGVLD